MAKQEKPINQRPKPKPKIETLGAIPKSKTKKNNS
jgi:hypothetical protein